MGAAPAYALLALALGAGRLFLLTNSKSIRSVVAFAFVLSGMFVWKATTILEELRAHQPDLATAPRKSPPGKPPTAAAPTTSEACSDARAGSISLAPPPC